MKVQVDAVDRTKGHRYYSEIEDWDICGTWQEVYRAAMKEYGRCTSKMFIDRKDGPVQHIGWVFLKRAKYDDCKETYLQETWICPLAKHEVKTIVEYALDRG